MTVERALEIIAAHGADARRWPDDERDDVLALAARDDGVAAAMGEAATMDGMIAGWARDVAPASFDAAKLVAAPRVGRWLAGGAVAAGLALAMVLGRQEVAPEAAVAVADTTVAAGAEGEAAGSDAEAFAYVFTPTVDEEDLI